MSRSSSFDFQIWASFECSMCSMVYLVVLAKFNGERDLKKPSGRVIEIRPDAVSVYPIRHCPERTHLLYASLHLYSR